MPSCVSSPQYFFISFIIGWSCPFERSRVIICQKYEISISAGFIFPVFISLMTISYMTTIGRSRLIIGIIISSHFWIAPKNISSSLINSFSRSPWRRPPYVDSRIRASALSSRPTSSACAYGGFNWLFQRSPLNRIFIVPRHRVGTSYKTCAAGTICVCPELYRVALIYFSSDFPHSIIFAIL